MSRISLSTILKAIAIATFAIGAFLGYDVGTKQVVVGTEVTDVFDVWSALLAWFCAFAAGMLFIGMARLLDIGEALLELK